LSSPPRRRPAPFENLRVNDRFVRAVFRFPRAQARRHGIHPAEPGAVVFGQRFGSAIHRAPHLHGLFLDGAASSTGGRRRPTTMWPT